MRLRHASHVAAIFIYMAAAGCGTEPSVPTSLEFTTPSLELTAIGQTHQLQVRVLDQRGDEMPSTVPFSWSSSDDFIVAVTGGGLVTAHQTGAAQITVQAGQLSRRMVVSVRQKPARLEIWSGNNQKGEAGLPLRAPLEVRVFDANNIPALGVGVTFTAEGGTVSPAMAWTWTDGVVGATFTLSTNETEPHRVTATVTGTALSATFTARVAPGRGLPSLVEMVSGFRQTGPAGRAVATRPTVRVRDLYNSVVPGATVRFTVTGGGGSVTGATVTTDANGLATVGSWVLGSVAGENRLTATVDAPSVDNNPIVFEALGTTGSSYNITIRYVTPPTARQAAVFADAELRWERLITGDVPDIFLQTDFPTCLSNAPTTNETVDDLLIYVDLRQVDGPGKVLGAAGPCIIRSTGLLPIAGGMFFDTEDLAFLDANDLFDDVILHEMGHVLGVGSLWDDLKLLVNPWSPTTPTADPYFSGATAIDRFNAAGGTTYTLGPKVPVENSGGPGTANGHWRESVLGRELMTGYANAGSNPLSAITVGSLKDMGYTVSYDWVDSFIFAAAFRTDEKPDDAVRLENDILQGPIRAVDTRGRVTALYRRP